jgi:Skp family chaperone for outer membrane proteins
MKVKQLILAALGLLLLTSPVFAQSDKIALVDTRAFTHPERGITRLIKAMKRAEREFAPRRAELSEMYNRLGNGTQGFAGPIPTDPRPMTPERRKELQAEAEATRRALDEKDAEMLRALNKRTQELTGPILQDIQRSLELFAKSRGITLLLDASQSACVVGCDKEATAALDITQEFIDEYNRLNP